MINIEIIRDGKLIKKLSVKGHANYAEEGKDIVCAAVSAITIGGANALENPKCYAFINLDGHFELNELTKANENDYHVLEVMLTQLKTVAEAYPKYVRVVEKGN